MQRLSGYVFDTYDDVDGQVLKSMVEDPTHLPQYVKTAARLTSEEVNALPDDQFALILVGDIGGSTVKMKKFATTDKGNTQLSVMYLLKQANALPPEMVKTAACNLIGALQLHGLEVPKELLKLASKDNSVSMGSSVSGKSQKPYPPGAKVKQIQYPEILEEPKESHDNPHLGNAEAAWDDVKERTNVEGTQGTNFMESPIFSQKEKYKVASAAAAREAKDLFSGNALMKDQSWRESPYFDVTGWDPSMPISDIAPPERTLLEGSYPIDGYDQVKTASAYFDLNWKSLPARDRHQYCVKLASRMSELGMPVPEAIERYGSTTYASDVDSYIEARRSYVHEESHDTLDMLLEKRAQVSPVVFAEAVAEFDKLNNLNWHWDAQIADPWYSTFGPSLEKIAEANWRYDSTGTRCSEDDLDHLARNGMQRLCKTFGHTFAEAFRKNPKGHFESLDATNKLILARLASDRHNGTYTE